MDRHTPDTDDTTDDYEDDATFFGDEEDEEGGRQHHQADDEDGEFDDPHQAAGFDPVGMAIGLRGFEFAQQGGGGGENGQQPTTAEMLEGMAFADDEAAQMEDGDYEPTEQEIMEYCEWLGMDPVIDRQLTWIAREALKAPLPENWKVCYTEEREVYYFNARTGESIWDHPMDAYYKALYKQEKAKLDRKRRHMRLFSGSLEIKPTADYFSDQADESCNDPEKPWTNIPESLIDAIDFRIYIDPVVLPTSGRTVSRHTIINNKWRDPFSREYVENRRLVPNVDKKMEVSTWLTQQMNKFFDQLKPTKEGLDTLVDMMPFILDKDDEVSVRAQGRLQSFIKKHAPAPTTVRSAPASATRSKEKDGGQQQEKASSSLAKSSSKALGESKKSFNATNGKTIGTSANRQKTNANGASNAKLQVSKKDAKEKTTTAPPPPPPSILDHIDALSPEQKSSFFGSLLTMSTSSSRELLFFLLTRMPHLSTLPVFRGFSEEVLNVLQLSAMDLSRTAATLIKQQAELAHEQEQKRQQQEDLTASDSATPRSPVPHPPPDSPPPRASARATTPPDLHGTPQPPGDSPTRDDAPEPEIGTTYETTNDEIITTLRWVQMLVKFEPPVNALHRLDFVAAVHLALSIYDSKNAEPDATAVNTLLRGADGWPQKLCACPTELIRKLIKLGTEDASPLSQIQALYDVLLNGSERGVEMLKGRPVASRVLQSVLTVAKMDASIGRTPNPAVDLLAALMVFHELVRVDDFREVPLLAIRVGYNLLPRLTRSQWRPKHFDVTVSQLITLFYQYPLEAWSIVKGTAVLFLIKELSKKKKGNEEVRVKLSAIEAGERRLEQSATINNWAILALGLQRKANRQNEEVTTTTTATATPTKSTTTKLPQILPSPSQLPKEPQPPQDSADGTRNPQQRSGTPCNRHLPFPERLDIAVKKRTDIQKDRANNVAQALQTLLLLRLKPKRELRGANAGGGGVNGGGSSQKRDTPPCTTSSSQRVAQPPSASKQQSGSNTGRQSSCPTLPPIRGE